MGRDQENEEGTLEGKAAVGKAGEVASPSHRVYSKMH